MDHQPVSGALTGLEKWDWPDTGAVPEQLVQFTLLGDANFPSAHRTAIQGALAFADSDPQFQSTISDMGSFFLCAIALYMDATGGLTHRRLRELTGEYGIISAGRASALLWRLRLGRFVEPAGGDSKRFVPTPAIRASMTQRIRVEFEALMALEPGVAPILERLDDPRVLNAFIRYMGDDMIASAGKPETRLEDFHKIAARNSGTLIFYALVEGALAGDRYPPATEVTVPVAAIARRLRVSRGHVHGLLKTMEEAGFVETRGSTRFLLPSLGATLRLFQALVMAAELRTAHRMLRDMHAQGILSAQAVRA